MGELALVVGLAVVALLVRLPNLQLVPAFTDELKDVYRGLLTSQGKLFPLTDTSSYIGSLWDWILAFSFRLAGQSVYLPRTVMMLLGVLTIPVAYLLGRAWGGRLGGALAALLLATAPSHVLVNSHIAWANCATPLFTTLAIWSLYETIQGRRLSARVGLPLTGLFWGLGLQTHPAVLGFLPAAALYLLWRRPSLLRTPSLYLAAVLFVLVNLNLLVFNLTNGLGSVALGVEMVDDQRGDSDGGEAIAPLSYPERVARLGWGLLVNLAGAVDSRGDDLEYLRDPTLWFSALIALAGLVWEWRGGNRLPALLLVSVAIVLPVFNSRYNPVTNGRYLTPLLPVLFAGIGALFAAIVRGSLGRPSGTRPRLLAWLVAGSTLLVVAYLALYPLAALQRHYRQAFRNDRTNEEFFNGLQQVVQNRAADEPVIVDAALFDQRLGLGGGHYGHAFQFGLAAENIPFQLADPTSDDLLRPTNRCRDQLLLLSKREPKDQLMLFERLDLRNLDGRPTRTPRDNPYRLYRLPSLANAPTC